MQKSLFAGALALLVVLPCVVSDVVIAGDGSANADIPITIVDRLPTVPVRIGNHTLRLGLDLGAEESISLTAEALKVVNVKSVPGNRQHFDSQGHLLTEQRFRIPLLRLGDAEFHDVEGTVRLVDPSYSDPASSRLGLIGNQLLQKQAVGINYASKQMTLSRSAGRGYCQGTPISFQPKWTRDVVTIVHSDVGPLTLLWDTGAQVTGAHKGLLKTGDDHIVSKLFVLGDTNFGPTDIYGLDFTHPEDVDGFVGYTFLSSHAVCFDFPGKQLFVGPANRPQRHGIGSSSTRP